MAFESQLQARPPRVEFEERSVEDRNATIKEGRVIYKSVNYVKIYPHGDPRSVVEKEAETWLSEISDPSHAFHRESTTRNAIPEYKRMYEDWKKGIEPTPIGTHIREWTVLTSAEVKNLINAGVYTIEDLASLPTSGLDRIGIGAISYKERAQKWLADAKHGKTEIDALTKKLVDQEKQIAELLKMVQSFTVDKPPTPVVKKKSTYKKKVKQIDENNLTNS